MDKALAAVRWIGLVSSALASIAFLGLGNYNMAGLMGSLAVLSLINIRRKRRARPTDADNTRTF
ncbi:hypothetical protein [Stutzerimonas urumqiensis]|uniref:hypothetical protein n=1 Tax=Stutzerimonas urumqiensis TaxID=638269 RepID=UPI003DA31F1C